MATKFNNIMDFIQLVFGFVNAPLFATFLLGMFWKRTTGHGAFSACWPARWRRRSSRPDRYPMAPRQRSRAAFLGTVVHHYPSEMAQNFWMAIWAWTTCFVVTIIVSLVSRPRGAATQGLVYSLTPKTKEHG